MEKRECNTCRFDSLQNKYEPCISCGSGHTCDSPYPMWSGKFAMSPFEAENIVKQPSHYTRFKIEPITFVMENDLPFHVGNIIKYACRAGYKLYEGKDAVESEIIDLEKVRRYAEMRISLLKGQGALGNGPESPRCL